MEVHRKLLIRFKHIQNRQLEIIQNSSLKVKQHLLQSLLRWVTKNFERQKSVLGVFGFFFQRHKHPHLANHRHVAFGYPN